jgi:hypothetical protein
MQLWITVLRNAAVLGTASGEASLLDLFPKVIGLLVDNWSVLGSTIDILEGYLLLDANAVLQVCQAAMTICNQHLRCHPRDMLLSSSMQSNNHLLTRAQIKEDPCWMPCHCHSSWLTLQLTQSHYTRAAFSRF